MLKFIKKFKKVSYRRSYKELGEEAKVLASLKMLSLKFKLVVLGNEDIKVFMDKVAIYNKNWNGTVDEFNPELAKGEVDIQFKAMVGLMRDRREERKESRRFWARLLIPSLVAIIITPQIAKAIATVVTGC